MDKEFKHKVIRNTLFTFYARLWCLALSIWLTPYIVSRLGNEAYGVWVLLAALVSYIGLIDLGLGASFVKHIAEYHARDDREGINGVYSTGMVFYLVVSAVLAGLAYTLIGPVLKILAPPPDMHGAARVVLILAIPALILGNFIGVYQSVLNGLQRMDLSNKIMMLITVIHASGCVIALELGLGLVGLAMNQILSSIIGLGITAYYAYRQNPSLLFNLRLVKDHLPRLLPYGLNMQVSNLTVLVNSQFDKLVVNRFVDVSHVTFYDIASRIPSTARSFPGLPLAALLPASSELQATRGKTELYEFFARASKYVCVTAIPIFAALIMTADLVIEAWVGPGYEVSVLVVRILCIGYLLNALAGPVTPLAAGMGRSDYQRNYEAISLILNVSLSVLLINFYGFYGAACGTTIAMSVAAVYYLWSFHSLMERRLASFLRRIILKPALCSLAACLVCVGVNRVLLPYEGTGRTHALLMLLFMGCLFALCYVVLILRSRYFDEHDITLFRDHVPLMGRLMRRPLASSPGHVTSLP
jgi:O-antigen/teichoic acid export membrane protein